MHPKDRILVALDVPTADDAVALARTLSPFVGGMKVGLELVNSAGFEIFSRLHDAGVERIFYDAKFHDIPNTVAGAIRGAIKHDVWMINVHTTGGAAMMAAARDAANQTEKPPLLIGVTVLTSIDQRTLNDELGVIGAIQDHVVDLARLCQSCGFDGVVASPHEAAQIAEFCGPDFQLVIPGVRPAGVAAGDQKRVATPADAIKNGAHYLVVGRAITGAPSPVDAARAIAEEIQNATEPALS